MKEMSSEFLLLTFNHAVIFDPTIAQGFLNHSVNTGNNYRVFGF